MRIHQFFPVRFLVIALMALITSLWVFGIHSDRVQAQVPSTEAALLVRLQQLNNNPTIMGSGQIFGTAGNNRLLGSAVGDFIFGDLPNGSGQGGDDLILGMGAPDTLQAGPGGDVVFGEDGNMSLGFYQGPGCVALVQCDDQLFGEAGNDFVVGEGGNDLLVGGQANGTTTASEANNDADILLAGDGDDKLVGAFGNDTLVGGLGNDIMVGSSESTDQNAHVFDGLDILWGDDENGTGSPGGDTFILGVNGVRFYDDNLSFTNGFTNRAVIKDFNPVRDDKIQLAKLPAPPPIGSVARYFTDRAANWLPGVPGVAIFYTTGISGQQPEMLAIVENVTSLDISATSASVIFN